MAKQTKELRAEFRAAQADAEALVAGLSRAAANWKPDARVWAAAEVLQHLVQTGEAYLPALRAALAGGTPAGGVPEGGVPERYGPVARWWIRSIGPEGGPLPTLRRLNPRAAGAAWSPAASDLDPAAVVASLRRVTDGFLGVLDAAEGLDVGRITMSSPLFGLLRLPVGAFLEANAGHTRRHLAQARRVAQRARAERAQR